MKSRIYLENTRTKIRHILNFLFMPYKDNTPPPTSKNRKDFEAFKTVRLIKLIVWCLKQDGL